ncbi:hypothetical protein PS874_04487 [Pseudomonas fluorescens]|nr:hypothetical protein PS874_04487 [Pseudomonas fluorescens]
MSRFNKIKNHSVTRNASALGIMQIANYATPLLLLPFLTHQLGIVAFGIVAITLAAIQLAFILTDYGFSLSATYAISVRRDDVEFINRKIGAVFGAKIILVFILLLTTLTTFILYPKLSAYIHYFLIGLLASIAQAFQPIWLFQGVERMKNITIYTVATKLIYALLVLTLVRAPGDAILVIYCWGFAQFIGLLASIHFMHKEGYKISWPCGRAIIEEFKDGAQFFWSRLAVAMYTSASTLIVGTHSTTQAAHFALCEQIYKAGQNVTAPINNAMFPYMAKHKNWRAFYKTLIATGLILTAGCIFLSFFSDTLLITLFGKEYLSASSILLVFLCTTVVNYFTVTFGYSAFAALGNIGIANTSVIAGAIIHVIILVVLYSHAEINAFNVALSILFTETLVMCIRLTAFVILKNKIRTSATSNA